MVKTGDDLLSEPLTRDEDETIDEMPDVSDTPFDKGFDLLSTTNGDRLEIMTRTNPAIAKAGTIALAHSMRFPRMSFIPSLYEQTMRHAVSINGKGRQEIATTVQAYSGAQASYYDADAEKAKTDDKSSFISFGGERTNNDGA